MSKAGDMINATIHERGDDSSVGGTRASAANCTASTFPAAKTRVRRWT